MHHGTIGLGARRLVLAVGLTEDAVLVELLNIRQDITSSIDQVFSDQRSVLLGLRQDTGPPPS